MTQPLTLSARCAATLFIVGFLMSTITDAAEIRLRDGVHRVSKAPPQVTPGPVLHRRETVTVCAAGYNLCPIKLGGGCCQDGYSCATESCFATTAGPVSCNGRSGYFACGVDVGGGCCPLGSVCERGGQCVPVPGVSYSHECSANSYLCPADLGYGCCQNGLACGKSQCYATEPQTYVFTKTATTTEDGGAAKTLTSTITTTVTPTGDSEPTDAFPPETQFAKYYPSAIDKVQPIVTNTEDKDDGGGGLTGAQIGGAVGGAVALLAIILVAAFLVIRRLNHVAKVVQEGGASVSGGPGSTADTSDYFKKGAGETEVDSLNTDMLSVSSPRTRHRSASSTTSEPGSLFGLRSAGGGSSGFSSRRQSHRSNSESTAAGSSTPGTWTRSNSTSVSRSGSSGRRTSGFGDVTGVSSDNEGEEIAELEAGERAVELPAEPVAASPGGSTGGSGGGGSGGRGDGLVPPPQPGHRRSSSAAVRGAPQLDMVSEAGEFHGYYGPADKLMGQTAVRQVAAADKAARPVSSPPAMAGASDPASGADGREES